MRRICTKCQRKHAGELTGDGEPELPSEGEAAEPGGTCLVCGEQMVEPELEQLRRTSGIGTVQE